MSQSEEAGAPALKKFVPNRGRPHLTWGEALAYAGKRDEARAAALGPTPSEKAELAGMTHG